MRKYIFVLLNMLFVSMIFLSCSEDSTTETEEQDPVAPEGMIFVKGGTFEMGDFFNEGSYENPVHSVKLSSYFISKYEVTQLEWSKYMTVILPDTAFMDYIDGVGDDYPVSCVNWYDVIVYCNKRSIDENLTPCYNIEGSTNPSDWGEIPTSLADTTLMDIWNDVSLNINANGYRLPTEAEWEYAAKGGVNWVDSLRYSGSNNIDDVAWYTENSIIQTDTIYYVIYNKVGTKLPNQLGIYDMSGNLWEWCWDWWDHSYYRDCDELGTVTNPLGADTGDIGEYRNIRGGCLFSGGFPNDCRVSNRFTVTLPTRGRYHTGFRVVRSIR